MDYFLFLLISIFSIIFYIFINYSLSILGYRTFGLNNEESDSSNQTDEKPLEQSSTRLSYEAYILAIFIRNLIICIGLSSFILFLNQTGLFDDLMNEIKEYKATTIQGATSLKPTYSQPDSTSI